MKTALHALFAIAMLLGLVSSVAALPSLSTGVAPPSAADECPSADVLFEQR